VISPHDAVQNHPLGTQAAPVCEGGVFAHRGLITADRSRAAEPAAGRLCRRSSSRGTVVTAQIVGGRAASL